MFDDLDHYSTAKGLAILILWLILIYRSMRRQGSIEDLLLGLEAVLADGRIVRITPIPRRAAGPDLRHLFLGAEGSIGIVTELTVRVFPAPESRKLLCYSFPDFDGGLEAARTILRAGWRPPVVRVYDAVETERHFGQWARDDACFLVLISEGAARIESAPWMLAYPALFLAATLYCFNFIGDGLRDALDPKDR